MSETSKRVKGHTLRNEGAPHDERGKRLNLYVFNLGTGGEGHGLCSCGAVSPLLPSASTRKAWHRRHKALFVDEAAR